METIFEFRLLYDGWESDNRAWITKDGKGRKKIMGTNHGSECQLTIKEIHEKLHETRASLAGLKQALKIMST